MGSCNEPSEIIFTNDLMPVHDIPHANMYFFTNDDKNLDVYYTPRNRWYFYDSTLGPESPDTCEDVIFNTKIKYFEFGDGYSYPILELYDTGSCSCLTNLCGSNEIVKRFIPEAAENHFAVGESNLTLELTQEKFDERNALKFLTGQTRFENAKENAC